MHTMERSVTIPQLALIAGTRVALGAGMGLLIGARLDRGRSEGRRVGIARVGRADDHSPRGRLVRQVTLSSGGPKSIPIEG
jgi:hypothetical protein